MIKWRKLNRSIHRDIGYLCVGLTLIYAISGIALNHIRDFNSNYEIETISGTVSLPDSVGENNIDASISHILDELKIHKDVKDTFMPSPTELEIFLDQITITIDLTNGNYQKEIVNRRPILYYLNYLHLNILKGAWGIFSDIYAFLLILLSISGIFIIKGKKGIKGRGGILLIIGILCPIIFAIILSFYQN